MDSINEIVVCQPVLTDDNDVPPTCNVIKTDAVIHHSEDKLPNIKNGYGLFSLLGMFTGHSICIENSREKMLQIACNHGNRHSVQHVLQQYNPDVNEIDHSGYTPLCKAVSERKNEIVKVLLDHSGIEVNKPCLNKHEYRRTPLHFACVNGSCQLVDLLMSKGSDVNAVDGENLTPIYLALLNGHTQIVNTLIGQGADITLSRRSLAEGVKTTPLLHVAVSNCNLEIVEILCSEGAPVNQLNSAGQSPLLVACNLRQTDIIKTLLKFGASVNLTDTLGQAPLLYVLEETKLLKNIEEDSRKKKIPEKCLDYTDVNGSDSNLQLVQLLIDTGAHINAIDTFGCTALDYCIKYGNSKAAAVLIKNGARTHKPICPKAFLLNCHRTDRLIFLLFHLNVSTRRLVKNSIAHDPGKKSDALGLKLRSVASLQEHCRLEIREHLKHNLNKTDLEQIDTLPITDIMKKYVSLNDLCDFIIKNTA